MPDTTFPKKLQKMFRGRDSSDNDALLAALLVGRRVVVDGEADDVYAALDRAITMSAPKDPARTWWAAHSVLMKALLPGETFDTADAEQLFLRASASQAKLNAALKGGSK